MKIALKLQKRETNFQVGGTRIVNGYDVNDRGFVVLIRAISPQDPEAYETCGGALINSLYVLTAGMYYECTYFLSNAFWAHWANFVKATAFASKAQCQTYNVPQAEKLSMIPKKSSKFTLV